MRLARNPSRLRFVWYDSGMNDPYAENEIQPDDLPLLAEITDEDAHAMAMQYADEQSEEQSPEPLFDFDHESEREDWDDDDAMTDAEADADVLRGAGMGNDEDYGQFGDSDLGGEF